MVAPSRSAGPAPVEMATQKSLNKVYDFIDAQPPKLKQALKLINQYLTKQPDWQMAKAIKALILSRMVGSREEAAKLAQSIAAAKPADEQVLPGTMLPLRRSRHVRIHADLAPLWRGAGALDDGPRVQGERIGRRPLPCEGPPVRSC